MKLGLGLYRNMLTPDYYRFARQAGATHIVAHLANYFTGGPKLPTATSQGGDFGTAAKTEIWDFSELMDLRRAVEQEGLELAAIENIEPGHWYDILLDGPLKKRQLENVKTTIRNMGKAGIPCLGYNFSIAAVWGQAMGPGARGGAESWGFRQAELIETPIPKGQVWNMVIDPNAPAGSIGQITVEQMWGRLEEFLAEVLPVAEESGVRLAIHPDDPPVPELRGTGRMVVEPHLFDRVLGISDSRSNGIDFCIGTVSEMVSGDVYKTIDKYSRMGRIVYGHFRNVRGKVPNYQEVFVDEGDVNMPEILQILFNNGFDGVLVPDHTPLMTSPGPWHAGMAHALGYMRALVQVLEATGTCAL